MLTEKQLRNQLNKYYKKHYGEKDTDEWFVNPKDNVWKFIRDGKTIILECNKLTGEVSQKHERSS